MSDDEDDDDLFGSDSDSDDTAELMAQAEASKNKKKKASAATTTTTSRLKKKKKTPPAVPKKIVPKKKAAAAGSSDDDGGGGGGGLFDSDSDSSSSSDEEEDDGDKKPAAAKKPPPMSKRERLEAMAAKRRKDSGVISKPERASRGEGGGGDKERGEGGYDSGDSYDSADFQRTREDDDFLDTTGEDADAVAELYAEQNFDDERPDREGGKKKKKRKMRYDDDEGGEGISTETGNTEPDNPIMAAVHRMKKKKREKKSFTDLEEEAKQLLGKMEWAADQDDAAIEERRPALNKLQLLSTVCDTLTRKDLQRVLLDFDLLKVCVRWVKPLPNGQLGNVTVRQRLLQSLASMTGEGGITPDDLKSSGFGKVVMTLYKHKSETPTMKQQHKKMIEAWSRPIFQKSGNMRDLHHVQRGTEYGLAALSRQQQEVQRAAEQSAKRAGGGADYHDLHSLIKGNRAESTGPTGPRVSVPFSKGFAFSVRPAARTDAFAGSPQKRTGQAADTRGKLSKRMVEKGRTAGKNQRSANISVEGRPTKG